MRLLLILLPFTLLAFFGFRSAPAPPPPGFAVVELFTSQGCSSCPSADVVLQELEARARKTGEPIQVLSFHVDYWNYLGWKDPYSSPYFSARQREYSERLQARTYTPQLVVNGKEEMIGSRRQTVYDAVDQALAGKKPQAGIEFTEEKAGNRVTVMYRATGELSGLEVTALLVQHTGKSSVSRGENRGRELMHVSVVRGMKTAVAETEGQLTVTAPEGTNGEDLNVVVLLQRGAGGEIVGYKN